MNWPDRIERVSRALLWLVLASVVVIVPLSFAQRMSGDEHELRTAKEKVAEVEQRLEDALEPKGPELLSIGAMGLFMSGLDVARAEGNVYFTNVSPRSGVVCVTGIATNPETEKTSESLARCAKVSPYSSATIQLMFAGGDLDRVCGRSQCSMRVNDVETSGG